MARPDRVVYLHIGAPKTGTTYIQDRLTLNGARLQTHDVLLPSGPRNIGADLFHFRAALDLLGQDWGGRPGHAQGYWDALARRVRRTRGTAIISHEILAPAGPDKVARAMNDLAGSEVHIVYSVRDLARQLPAAWQESIKQGRRWTFNRFLDAVEDGSAWFFHAFHVPRVLSSWGRNLPPERVHVVTVPRSGNRDPDLLWRRFCEAFSIEPEWAPLDSVRTNRSLGIAETQLIRHLNRRMDRRVRHEAEYDQLIRDLLAEDHLHDHGSPRVLLPPDRFEWAEQQSQLWVDWIEGSGVHLIGDTAELRPLRPPDEAGWVDPDKMRPREVLDAALDALEVMTREAAIAKQASDSKFAEIVRDNARRILIR